MKPSALPFLLLVTVASAETAQHGLAAPLTMDPERYADALRAVHGLPQPPAAAKAPESADTPASHSDSAAPGVEDWQAVMRDAGTELADVRLLVLLQRLNPLEPPAARAEDYAAVLRLHHLMLAGNARACLKLARACREGRFESGLAFIQSDALATVLERRAVQFQLPTPAPVSPEGLRPEAPAGAGA